MSRYFGHLSWLWFGGVHSVLAWAFFVYPLAFVSDNAWLNWLGPPYSFFILPAVTAADEYYGETDD